MNSTRAFLAVPLLAVLAACSGSETPASSTSDSPSAATPAPPTEAAGAAGLAEPALPQMLEAGKSWTLAHASDENLKGSAAEAGIFIEVQDARIVGYAGCNRFSAPLQRGEGGAIKLDAVVASKRGCASDALNAAEQTFLRTLGAAQRFELTAEGLVIHSADGAELGFSPGRPKGSEGEASQAEGT